MLEKTNGVEPAPASLTITNAAVVQPAAILDRATVRVENDLIAAVESGPVSAATATVVDARGAYLLPGVVDLHNDNLEVEINPRARANLPLSFAVQTMERRLAAAGVTSEFHAISFMEHPQRGRSLTAALERSRFIAALAAGPARPVRHYVQHRLDVRTPEAFDAAFASLALFDLRYLSLNDHTPGQGQYRDVERLIAFAQENSTLRGGTKTEAEFYYQRMELAQADTETVPNAYRRVEAEARRLPMVIATHDDDEVEKVDLQGEIGATVAEFPVTFAAAERARERGMTIVVGAPNVLRGGSQSGNLAALDLAARGLADAICADYHAPCLIPAAFAIVRAGLADLPAAVRMITLNPARAVGLDDRGVIAPGCLADLALVRLDAAGLPHVEATYVGGRQVFAFPAWQEVPSA